MFFYSWNRGDIGSCVSRSHFDAEQGAPHLAVMRLEALMDILPNEFDLLYNLGLIRSQYLGQGQKSFDCFGQAYSVIRASPNAAAFRRLAATKAATLAPNKAEFLQWANLVLQDSTPKDASHRAILEEILRLEQDMSFEQIQENSIAYLQSEAGVAGILAALLEVFLVNGGNRIPLEEVALRRLRAQKLRELDEQARSLRETRGEVFLPAERLALHEALAELERALSLDEYDAELHNLKSAWLNLLERYDDALVSADKALSLRPTNYLKPYINQGIAFHALQRDAEAITALEKGLKAAGENISPDVQQMRQQIQSYSQNISLNLESFIPLFERVLEFAHGKAETALDEWKISKVQVSDRLLKRALEIGQADYLPHVQIIVEPMADFSPEVVYGALRQVQTASPIVFENCLKAICHIAVHSSSVEQKAALRLLALLLFSVEQTSRMPELYCRFLELYPSLDPLLRAELSGFNSKLPDLIAEPCESLSIDRESPLSSFLGVGEPFISSAAINSCLGLVALLILTIIVGLWLFFNN